MKIGIFGGTFNPPHMGHLITLESVRDQLRFDEVLLIPSRQPPNKPNSSLASGQDRFEMTGLAVRGNSSLKVSDIELRREGTTYTVDTLRYLAGEYRSAELYFIMGADNYTEFETWKRPDEILTYADVVVMSRPGWDAAPSKSKFARAVHFLNVPLIGISGTDIRRRVKLGRSIRYLVPRPVEDYISQHNLYKK
jgi:nicotinate-nucleotide adenylyltransferase